MSRALRQLHEAAGLGGPGPRTGLTREFGKVPACPGQLWGMVSRGSCRRRRWGCLACWGLSQLLQSDQQLQRGLKVPPGTWDGMSWLPAGASWTAAISKSAPGLFGVSGGVGSFPWLIRFAAARSLRLFPGTLLKSSIFCRFIGHHCHFCERAPGSAPGSPASSSSSPLVLSGLLSHGDNFSWSQNLLNSLLGKIKIVGAEPGTPRSSFSQHVTNLSVSCQSASAVPVAACPPQGVGSTATAMPCLCPWWLHWFRQHWCSAELWLYWKRRVCVCRRGGSS